MKPAADKPLAGCPLDALIDLCDAAPTEGDDRLAVWLETKVHAEQVKANEAGDLAAFRRAQGRAVAAAYYRARICTALNLTTTGEPRRVA